MALKKYCKIPPLSNEQMKCSEKSTPFYLNVDGIVLEVNGNVIIPDRRLNEKEIEVVEKFLMEKFNIK